MDRTGRIPGRSGQALRRSASCQETIARLDQGRRGPAQLEVAPIRPHLRGIQVARGCAATAVILYHVSRHLQEIRGEVPFAGSFQWGHAAVDFFFVLSGFVIQHVHGGDIGQPARLRRFARRRFIRVYPLFWIALALFTVQNVLAPSMRTPTPLDVVLDATLWRHQHEPIVGVQWSLSLEVCFYFVFGLLIAQKRVGVFVVSIWAAAVGARFVGLIPVPDEPMLRLVTSPYGLQFLMGMAVARQLARRPSVSHWVGRALTIAGGLAFAATALAEVIHLLDGYGPIARLLYGASSAILLMGLVRWETERSFTPPVWLESLGACSYSIYLFHLIGISLAGKILKVVGIGFHWPTPILALWMIAWGLGVGWGLGHFVERRLLRSLSR